LIQAHFHKRGTASTNLCPQFNLPHCKQIVSQFIVVFNIYKNCTNRKVGDVYIWWWADPGSRVVSTAFEFLSGFPSRGNTVMLQASFYGEPATHKFSNTRRPRLLHAGGMGNPRGHLAGLAPQ
jgi:hypothetical protein